VQISTSSAGKKIHLFSERLALDILSVYTSASIKKQATKTAAINLYIVVKILTNYGL
jgi:hypothetical protein